MRKLYILKSFLFFGLLSTALMNAQQFKALVFTETKDYHHESIAAGIKAIRQLAERNYFVADLQQEAEKITYDKLKQYDVIIFLSTTGDIFTDNEKAAIQKFIRSGKGFVGIHGAACTEYNWEWYTQLLGRMFYIHPEQQTAMLKFADRKFPGLEHFPEQMRWTDEWYQFSKDKSDNLHTLVLVDEATYNPDAVWKNADKDASGKVVDKVARGMGKNHPVAWYHEFDGGRAFYTALGHNDSAYSNQWFLDHIYGGIYYAATGKGLPK